MEEKSMTVSLSLNKKVPWLLLFCLLLAVGSIGCSPTAEKITATNNKVIALLFPQNPPTNTDLNTPNITTTQLGDALYLNNWVATIIGDLSWGGGAYSGIYGFNVDLVEGTISNGAMSSNGVTSFNLHSGIGYINGNNFEVGGFHGSVPGADTPGTGTKLTGSVSNGYNKGDLGATGHFWVTDHLDNPIVDGDIINGERVN
jgi:hypothetical protein